MYEELLISGNEIETKNKRIFMSNEEFVNQKTFDDILDSCSSAIELNDIDAIVNIMRRYVDGFTYEN